MQVYIGHDLQSLHEIDDTSPIVCSPSVLTRYETDYIHSKRHTKQTGIGLICAKEAVIKALSGITDMPGFGFKDIQVSHCENGKPRVEFTGLLCAFVEKYKAAWDISITHSDEYVSAVAILILLHHD